MHQGAPIITLAVTGRPVDPSVDGGRGKETPLVRQQAALEVKVINPDRFVTAVGQVHAAVIGGKSDAVADDEVAVHALHGKVRVETEQLGLASDKIQMHAGTPVPATAITLAVIEHQTPVAGQRVGHGFAVRGASRLQADALESGPCARHQRAIGAKDEGADVVWQRKTFDTPAFWIEAADGWRERVHPIEPLLTPVPLRRFAQDVGLQVYGLHLGHAAPLVMAEVPGA